MPARARAEARIALLIGNEAYAREIGQLANPHNDVALLEEALKGLGFEVVTVRHSLSRHRVSQSRDGQAEGSKDVRLLSIPRFGAALTARCED